MVGPTRYSKASDILDKYHTSQVKYEYCPNCGKQSVREIEGHKECANCEHKPEEVSDDLPRV